MASLETLFPTKLYRARLARTDALNAELAHSARTLAREDRAGAEWCRAHGYQGYTSYGSLNDLPWRDPAFAALQEALEPHVEAYARELDFDLSGRALKLDSMWANILAPGGAHAGHIHPLSAISGTYYVATPEGASALKFEDPRLGFMMGAPAQKSRPRSDNRRFVYVAANAGALLLWESWLRHEVPANGAKAERISVSFNYRLD